MDNKPFIQEIDRLFNVTNGDKTAENIRFKVTFDYLSEGLLECELIGNQTHFDKVSELYFPGIKEKSLKVYSPKDSNRDISFDIISIPSIPLMSGGRDIVQTYDHISIEIDNLRMVNSYSNDIENPKIHYHFTKPNSYWHYINSYKLNEETGDVEYENPLLKNHDFPGLISFKRQKIKDVYEFRDNSAIIETSQNALVFEPNKHFSPEELIKLSDPIVNIIEKQFSLLQRRRSVWYKYVIELDDRAIIFIKNYERSKDPKVPHHRFIVDISDSREFLNKTFPQFQQYLNNGLDLISPINYYLSALEVKYIEAAFGMLFFALEKLKDEICKAYPNKFRSQIFTEESNISFDEYRALFKDLTKEYIDDKETRKLLYEKLLGLNRPSFKQSLKEILSQFQVKWKDLYVLDDDLNFIDLRNKLFHSNTDIDNNLLFKEKVRLKAVFERIILSLLGWENIEKVPQESLLDILNET